MNTYKLTIGPKGWQRPRCIWLDHWAPFDDAAELIEEIQYLDKEASSFSMFTEKEEVSPDDIHVWTFTISTHEATVLALRYDVFSKCERI